MQNLIEIFTFQMETSNHYTPSIEYHVLLTAWKHVPPSPPPSELRDHIVHYNSPVSYEKCRIFISLEKLR